MKSSFLTSALLALSLGIVAPKYTLAEAVHPDADNSARNARDAKGGSMLPTDQGNSEIDRTITQTIRAAVVANDKLSMNAHNVKIITLDQVVTLRGPVKTAAEKAEIASVATKTSGVKHVDNQLEIETTP